MAVCVDCGRPLVPWEVKRGGGACGGCHSLVKQREKAQASEKQDAKSNKSSSHTVLEGSTTPATAFTSLAWVIVALTFICTLIATFAIAADGDTFLAMMMFIGGCFSAVLLGLLTEISANIAKLVNNSR